ncbi:uncharacterized protein LOC144350403 [Saccoglossus kowalevskii]
MKTKHRKGLIAVVLTVFFDRCLTDFNKQEWIAEASQHHPGKSHSYLDWPRIHFAGYYRADAPTGNNVCDNYDIKTFDQKLREQECLLLWNAKGSGRFYLEDCKVTSVCYKNGECVTEKDDLIGKAVISNKHRPQAILADLDPSYHIASTIYGMHLTVHDTFTGRYLESSIREPNFNKVHERRYDEATGVVFQSLLVDVEWDDTNKGLVVVRQMMDLSSQTPQPNVLSIKIILDYFEYQKQFSNFSQGRLVGSIGVAGSAEPLHMLRHRELHSTNVNFGKSIFRVLYERGKLLIDLGNSLTHNLEGNPDPFINEVLQVVYPLEINTRFDCSTPVDVLGYIPYSDSNWYTRTAGIVQIPETGILTLKQLHMLHNRPLLIRQLHRETKDCTDVILKEHYHGFSIGVMGDSVWRVNPGDKWEVKAFVMYFGDPAIGLQLRLQPDNSINGTWCGNKRYPYNQPEEAVNHTLCATTDHNGIASFNFHSYNPGNPRPIEGQLYFYHMEVEIPMLLSTDFPIAILLYSSYTVSEDGPTWYQDIYPIFKMYANMFPTMTSILNLASYEDVVRKKEMIKATMSLPITDPSYMPVTRDLSNSKQSAVLEWLDDPKLGTRPLVTLEELHGYLQTALEIELSTIPPYLSALFSIRKGHNNEVANILRSVVLEEMLHMTLVANILSSICGSPTLNESSVIPRYPTTLPGNVHPGLTVSLGRFSLGLVEDVFLKIEEPDETLPLTFRQTLPPPHESTEETEIPYHHYDTIGQFYYQNIWQSLNYLASTQDNLFSCANVNKQVTEQQWYSHVVEKPFAVMNLSDAWRAIQLITEQGEGSSPTQPYDSLGELSHYYKFLEIVMGYRIVLHEPTLQEFGKEDMGNICHLSYASMFSKLTTCGSEVNDCRATNVITKCGVPYYFTGEKVSFYENGVWPTIDNPSSTLYPDSSKVRYVSDRFNEEYSNLLRCLHESFNVNSGNMVECMSMMAYLEQLGRQLVEMPIKKGSNRNAAPTFEYVDLMERKSSVSSAFEECSRREMVLKHWEF